MNWWVSAAYQNDPVLLGSWIIWVVGAITLHELGHGWMAIRCGDDYPIHSGHMTLNPLVHIPPMAWLMFALFGITWGQMPVNPSNFNGRYDEAKVAFAGPLVNILLFLLCATGHVLWVSYATGVGDPVYPNVETFLFVGAMLNCVLVIFNLLPIPPLDGAHILSNFSSRFARLWQSEQGAVFGLMIFAAIFFVGASKIWSVAREITWTMLRFGESLLP